MIFPDKPDYMFLPRKGDAAAVECAVYPPRLSGNSKSAGMVLHLYGSRGSCRSYNMMRESYSMVRRLLWERGYWLVVPDLGGAHWMNEKTCKTLDSVIKCMVKERRVTPARISVLGTSMGAGCGLAYAMRRPGRIRSICAIFPMTDFVKWGQESPKCLKGIAEAHGVEMEDLAPVLEELSPLKHVAAFADIPVFLIHGDTDTTVLPHHSGDFSEALRKQGSPVTYLEVHNVAHKDVVAEPYQKEIADFLTNPAAKSDINIIKNRAIEKK
jgi:dipeptidyl aminopeptidase/acylaminoacyl peptidase